MEAPASRPGTGISGFSLPEGVGEIAAELLMLRKLKRANSGLLDSSRAATLENSPPREWWDACHLSPESRGDGRGFHHRREARWGCELSGAVRAHAVSRRGAGQKVLHTLLQTIGERPPDRMPGRSISLASLRDSDMIGTGTHH